LLGISCEDDVKVVHEQEQIGGSEEFSELGPALAPTFLTLAVPGEGSENKVVGHDSHNSAAPTVTTGFMAFLFDIR
jgi:hypothetical protein